MPIHHSTICCQHAVVDRFTNLPSYFNCFDRIGIPRLPYIFPPVTVASLWEKEKTDSVLEYKMEVLSPSDKKVKDSGFPEIELKSQTHRTFININSFEITESGRYLVVIKYKAKGKWVVATKQPIILYIEDNPTD